MSADAEARPEALDPKAAAALTAKLRANVERALRGKPRVVERAVETLISGGHLLQMMTNAQWISQKQIRPARVKNGEIRADEFPDARDRWSPRTTPSAFEAVILHEGTPSDTLLADAIHTQFALVLRREPDEVELAKYLKLTREAVALAGNSEGLRQMLVAVLLESEFLYRLEFGAGTPDAHGRLMLSPREGAYAISYALGDRGPDAALL